MRCKKCGNELRNGAKFCRECGTPCETVVNEDVNSAVPVSVGNNDAVSADMTDAFGDSSTEISFKSNKKIWFRIKLLALIGIICFFFPFVTVSCSGMGEEIELCGYNFFDGTHFENYEVTSFGGLSSGIFNIFLFLAGLAAVWVILTKKVNYTAAPIWLLLFRLTAESYYKIDGESLGQYGSLIDIEYGAALYICMLVFIAVDVAVFLVKKKILPVNRLTDTQGMKSYHTNLNEVNNSSTQNSNNNNFQ